MEDGLIQPEEKTCQKEICRKVNLKDRMLLDLPQGNKDILNESEREIIKWK